MRGIEPQKTWWTAAEIAEARLPELPGSVQGVNALADRLTWRSFPHHARRRAGRGGGWEYHWTLMPAVAQSRLLRAALAAQDEVRDPGTAWAEFEALPEKVKAQARARLKALRYAEGLYSGGMSQVEAMYIAGREAGVAARTMYNWQELIEGVPPEDRLAYLVPKHRLIARKVRKASCSAAFMAHLKSLYLRLEQPTFRQCYRTACKLAKAEGWDVLTERTAQRRLNAEVPRVTQVFSREGVAGLERCYPAQQRDRTGMVALEGVNADCHKIDVFVRWPDGTVNRPQIVGFQDLYSGKILSWRVDHDPNKVMVMAAFGELVENWGLPRHCLFDNGREFANKWMTAGTPTRFRFKVREDDPLGVLPLLGIEVHWATPGHGQAKPIERAFRDLASDIAKDIRFAGAYVGNRPDAKPENYGSRAIPAETFLQVLSEGIVEHNARQGRLSDTAQGRSFDETFAESYAQAPIRKATEEQRRLWMMGQHVGRLRRDNGQLRLYGNYYHSDWMSQKPGARIVARFDPEDLHSGVHIYDGEGAYLGFAECRQKVGFFDVVGAKEAARRKSRLRRAARELRDAQASIPADEIGKALDALAPVPSEPIEAKVVAPEFGRKGSALPGHAPKFTGPAYNPEVEAEREAMIVKMETPVAPAAKEEPGDRYRRARDIIARSEAGDPVGREEAQWAKGYSETAEYQGLLHMEQHFGKDGVG